MIEASSTPPVPLEATFRTRVATSALILALFEVNATWVRSAAAGALPVVPLVVPPVVLLVAEAVVEAALGSAREPLSQPMRDPMTRKERVRAVHRRFILFHSGRRLVERGGIS